MYVRYKPIIWTLEELEELLSGIWFNKPKQIFATGTSTIANNIGKNDIFIANINNSNRLIKAFNRGACLAIVDKRNVDLFADYPVLLVKNIQIALRTLALYQRKRIEGKVIGITGTVGKTTSKDMLVHMLEVQGLTHYSYKNLNNPGYLADSIARMPVNSKYGIFEIGMLQSGIVKRCAMFVQPDVALITTIGEAHMVYQKNGIDSIIDEKSQIVKHMKKNAKILLPIDNKYYKKVLKKVKEYNDDIDIYTFGIEKNADFRILKLNQKDIKMTMLVDILGEKISVTFYIPSHDWAMNVLSALAAVKLIGGDVKLAAKHINSFELPFRRGQRFKATIDNKIIEVIDDSWNANPLSLKASLNQLATRECAMNGRRVVFLGDMLELGTESKNEHEKLLKLIIKNNIKLVFTIGKEMKHLYNILPNTIKGIHLDNTDFLLNDIFSLLKHKDLVLVKGSNSMNLWKIISLLIPQYPEGSSKFDYWTISKEINEK